MSRYTIDHFLATLAQIRRTGSAGLKFLRESGGEPIDLSAIMVRDLGRVQGMIHFMTRDERRSPSELIDESRRRRIAAGCGASPREVGDLVKQFEVMANMLQRWGRTMP